MRKNVCGYSIAYRAPRRINEADDAEAIRDIDPQKYGEGPDFRQLDIALDNVSKAIKHLQAVKPEERAKVATVFSDIALTCLDGLIFFIKRYSTQNNNQKSNLIRAQNLIVAATDAINTELPEGLEADGENVLENKDARVETEAQKIVNKALKMYSDYLNTKKEAVSEDASTYGDDEGITDDNTEEDAAEDLEDGSSEDDVAALNQATKDLISKALDFYFKHNSEDVEGKDSESDELSAEDTSDVESDSSEDSEPQLPDDSTEEKTDSDIEGSILNQLADAVGEEVRDISPEQKARLNTKISANVPKLFDDFAENNIHENRRVRK